MKYLVLTILILIVGCKEEKSQTIDRALLQRQSFKQDSIHNLSKNKNESSIMVGQYVNTEIPFAPTINQEVWYQQEEGRYCLQTYVLTEKGQIHPTGGWAIVSSETKYSPYYKTICGTFNSIKSQKKSEYEKASNFLYKGVGLETKRIDSVRILNELK